MKPSITINGEKTLKILDTLPPELRDKMMAEIKDGIRSVLSDVFEEFLSCDYCPIVDFCKKHPTLSCRGKLYNYLREDFNDGENENIHHNI